MIDVIPNELFSIITQHLSYNEIQNMKETINIDMSEGEMFTNSKLFQQNDIYLQKAFNVYDITPLQFFHILKNSALDIMKTYELMLAISTNKIDNNNKYDYNIEINYEKKNNIQIKNTIIVMQIIMRTIEHFIIEEFIINNPYHYTSINITNNLLNYFHSIVCNSYTVNKSFDNCYRFNLMMFECSWYKSNINLYHIYLLYLLNIDLISSECSYKIHEICNHSNPIFNVLRSKDGFFANIFHIFQDKSHIMKLFDRIYPIR